MKYIYPAVFRKEPEGMFYIFFPDIRCGGTQGDDLTDGLEMAEDFLAGAIYAMENRGDEIPPPSDINALVLEEGDFVTLVKADTGVYRRFVENRTIKKTLTMPSWLNARAEAANVNFSQLLQEALKTHLKIAN